jgi:hypothetical protein
LWALCRIISLSIKMAQHASRSLVCNFLARNPCGGHRTPRDDASLDPRLSFSSGKDQEGVLNNAHSQELARVQWLGRVFEGVVYLKQLVTADLAHVLHQEPEDVEAPNEPNNAPADGLHVGDAVGLAGSAFEVEEPVAG